VRLSNLNGELVRVVSMYGHYEYSTYNKRNSDRRDVLRKHPLNNVFQVGFYIAAQAVLHFVVSSARYGDW
jgi:hypothetical protein